MADKDKPYRYFDIEEEFNSNEVKDLIHFHSTKNNVKEPIDSGKKKVFNPLSLLLLDPVFAPQMWAKKLQYNKKIKAGELDKVTDDERLLFESKADSKKGIFSGYLNPENFIPIDKEKEVEIGGDIATGAVTGLPLGVKAIGELLTIGVDLGAAKINDKFGTTLNPDLTKKLDEITRKFLNATGEPETLAGEITQLGVQFALPMKVVDKMIRNIGRLKPFINKTFFMKNANLVNKSRFIQGSAGLAQRMGTGALSLGASDFIASGGERKLDPIFFKRTNEEGKSGRELAAARFANKIKFGAEGGIIGAGFPLIGTGLGLLTKLVGYTGGVAYDTLGNIINPFVTLATKALALDPILIPSVVKGARLNAQMWGEVGTRVALTAVGKGNQIFRQIPDYKDWRRFTVDSTDGLKSGLKKIDNALSYIRSAGKNTAEALFIKGSAGRDIRASAKKIQDLLSSIENKSYDLAKGFQKLYNGKQTSPSNMNQYADEVLEVLEGRRKLNNLPEVLQSTTKLLKDEIVKINKQYKKYLPDDDGFAHALNGGTKSYIKKSFAFLNNPGRALPESDKIYQDGIKFVKKLINKDKNLQDEALAFSKSNLLKKTINKNVSKTEAINDYANVMIKQVLNMGKIDNKNPFEVLRKVGEKLQLENFLKKGEELPDVIAKLLGQERDLRNNVLFTTSSMMSSIANKQMYDTLGRIMLKQGQLFESQVAARASKEGANIVQIGKLDGMHGLNSTMQGLWTDAETYKVLTSNRGPLDFLAEIPIWNNYLQFKGGVQWGKTVGSPATTVRNFVTAADFALMRGLIGGRSSVTGAVKMQIDDIYNAGKLSGTAEQKLLANIEEGIRYGALDENIVVTELRELLAATQKGKKINSMDTMIKAVGDARIIELMGKIYAGGDHVWKWYGYNWYKSFLKDYAKNDMKRMQSWFSKVAGRELDLLNNNGSKKTLDEAIKEASAYYVRNTMPTYSKVPPLIKGVRNLPLGNFVAFPAETLRGTFNVMNISTKEIISGDPILREMGLRGLLGMFTTQGAKGIAIMKTYGAITGITEDLMEEYRRNLVPGYQKNSQLVAISKAVQGKFKMVDLSTVLPYDYVRRPFVALMNAIKNKELNEENTGDFLWKLATDEAGPLRELMDPFISTPIGNEAFKAIRTGKTKSGKTIWGPLDTETERWDKSVDYIVAALEPGVVTSMKQAYSAFMGTEYKGRVYDMKDVLMGLFTGIKPYEVDLNKNIDFLINDYTNIRKKAYQGSTMYNKDTYGSAVEADFIRIQRNIWREQRRIYNAIETAKKFGVTKSTIRKELKARGVSYIDISKIMRGDMDVLPYSKPRMEEKIKELKRNDKNSGYNEKRSINKKSFYPMRELDKIMRKLRRQKLDEPFIFDLPEISTMELNNQESSLAPLSNNQSTQTAKLPLEPLPPQPAVRVASNVNASPPFASLPKNDQFKLLFPNG